MVGVPAATGIGVDPPDLMRISTVCLPAERIDKAAAVDRLWEIAIAHALVRAFGEDRVQSIIGEAFADADFRPMHSEVA
jgi:hypothetical protein